MYTEVGNGQPKHADIIVMTDVSTNDGMTGKSSPRARADSSIAKLDTVPTIASEMMTDWKQTGCMGSSNRHVSIAMPSTYSTGK